jgi:hypothetical protein
VLLALLAAHLDQDPEFLEVLLERLHRLDDPARELLLGDQLLAFFLVGPESRRVLELDDLRKAFLVSSEVKDSPSTAAGGVERSRLGSGTR